MATPTAVRPFEDEPDVPKPATLYVAYQQLPEPKPTRDKIRELARKGVLTSVRNAGPMSGVAMVDDFLLFALEVDEWMRANPWRTDLGGTPEGFVPIGEYVRTRYREQDLRAADLISTETRRHRKDNTSLTGRAKSDIKDGAIEGAMQTSARGIWVADPREIEMWLLRGYGLRATRET